MRISHDFFVYPVPSDEHGDGYWRHRSVRKRSGGGKQYTEVTLYPTADGTQGPFTSFLYGIIRLAG